MLNFIDIIAGDLSKKENPEAYLMYALYDQDSNRYEVEDGALRNSPVDCFSEGPESREGILTRSVANKHEELTEGLYIEEDGYMEAFVVNESSEDVWPACRQRQV
jgi:hypothetical protein